MMHFNLISGLNRVFTWLILLSGYESFDSNHVSLGPEQIIRHVRVSV